MSAPKPSDVTLLTEHLTYRPAALIDDIVNSINILAFKATEAVEKGLLAANLTDLGFKAPSTNTPEGQAAAIAISETAQHEIENGVHQLETLLESKIDKNFDRLEIYALRNILNIPTEIRDWVQLSHYEGLKFNQERDAPNTESIKLLRSKLRETQKLHAWLRAESARNDATIATLKSLLSTQALKQDSVTDTRETYPAFSFLHYKRDLTGDIIHPITTTTSFAVSQMPALESILENLKPRLEQLVDDDNVDGLVGEEDRSWRRQRLEFIEKETRRHLEKVRGLELGEMGDVRDVEWQGTGRKFRNGEVEDLERVVAMVSGRRVERES